MHCLIVGCGSIGERHLQALLKLKNIKIFVIEKNINRINELKKKYDPKIFFFKDFNNLSKLKIIKFNLVILSGNSDNRFILFKKVLKNVNAKNILFEKIVFSNERQYANAIKILKRKKINNYVNCPRRMINFFKKISLKEIHNHFYMKVTGSKWGLFSNSIHFLDLFYFLTKKIPILKQEKINKKLYNSKRSGFLDGYGVLTFETNNKSKLILEDKKEGSKILNVIITYNKKTYNLRVKNGIEHYNNNLKNMIFKMPFQSDLTNILANKIRYKKKIDLPSLNENFILQKEIFKALRKYIIRKKKTSFNIINIT